MSEVKEQQTIRIPPERNAYIKQKAASAGSSYNSFINVLIDLGLRVYEEGVIPQKK